MLSRSPSMRHVTFRLTTRKAKVLAAVGVVSLAGAYKVSTDEGLRRSIRMNSVCITPLIKYRYYDWRTRDWPKEERAAVFEELHEKYSKVAIDIALELQGFYIKFGQVIAGLDNSGSVPQQYVDRLKVLQTNCPSRPVKDIIRVIEEDLGKPFNEVFMSIDPIPLGSASIGQVHRAKLLNGQEVAVKVQHPNAERFFKVDIATSKALMRLAQPEQLVLFDEIEKQFATEFDYALEAQNLRDMNSSLASAPKEFSENIVIPKPLISTRRVLVMTMVPGKTLHAQQKQFIRQLAEEQHKSESDVEKELLEKIKAGDIPKPPSATTLAAYKMFLQTRDAIRNGVAFTYNSLIGNWTGAKIKYEYSEMPMDAETALRRLYGFFGYSLFTKGIFSSDPHGGNVMHVIGGKLGLIDMGQVKRLSLENRLKFARLVVALAHDDGSQACTEQIAQLWRDCGYKTKYNNADVTADFARFFFDRMDDELVDKYGGMALFQENINKADPQVHLPDDFVMCFRTSCLLRLNAMGLGHGLAGGLYSRVTPIWEKYAIDLLNANHVPIPPRVDQAYLKSHAQQQQQPIVSNAEPMVTLG